ncbi:MAG: hypothetical protein QW160_04255 [Candidatus Bathyarchaeia archaeon]
MKPLRVENLSSGTALVYEGCPHCLTEVNMENEASMNVEQQVKPNLELEHKREEAISIKPSAETARCPHYFGYLSECSTRDRLPEECMICPKIVQCMLKSVTG